MIMRKIFSKNPAFSIQFVRNKHMLSHRELPVWRKHSKKFVFGTIVSGLLGYDGIAEDFAFTGSAERFLRSSCITLSILGDYVWHLWDVEEDDPKYKEILKQINRRSAEKILNGCLKNGGLYIKVGQGVSHINHILPKEFLEPLKRLHNQCLPRKSDEVDKLFLQEFGKKPLEVFKSFNYEPIAAASLAQVFEAETNQGDKVAVKVQYIDLQKRFRTDLGTIQMLSNCVGAIFKDYQFGWILTDLRNNLLEELDFLHEGHNLERCKEELKKFDYVYVPKVYWELSCKKVLTCEFIEGYKIGDLENIKKEKLDVADIDFKIFQMFSEQIFNTGFVHADPHEGNIFVRKTKKGRAEIVLIDHGLYEQLPYAVRQSLCHFWKSIVLGDHKEMQKYSRELNVDDYSKFAEVLLQRPLEMKGARFSTKLTVEELEYLTETSKQHFDLVIKTLKQMPRNMLFVVRNLNTVRAIAREHGDPIDRPKVMARHALKCITKNSRGIRGFFSWFTERLFFEYKLWIMTSKYWAVTTYLKFLTKIGRSPDSSHLFKMNAVV